MTFLCDLEIPNTIVFSPDAQQVLYSTSLTWSHRKGTHPVSTLWLAETGNPKSARQITSGLSKDHIPRWNPDGTSIAFVSDRAKAGERWAIHALNIRQSVFEFSPDGTTIAYLSADEKTKEQKDREEEGDDVQVWGEDLAYVRLRTVNVQTKQVNRAGVEHQRHVTGFSWSPDGKRIAFTDTTSPNIEEPYLRGSRIAVLTVKDQTVKEICTIPNAVNDLTWAADGQLYFISGIPIDKVCAGATVYAVSSESGVESDVEANDKPWTRVAFGYDDTAVGLLNVGGKVLVKSQKSMEDQLCLLANGSLLTNVVVVYSKAEELQAFGAILSPGNNEILLATASSSVNQPVEVYSTTTSSGHSIQLSSHGAAFQGQTFGSSEFISCRSADDEVDLDGVFLRPDTSSTASKDPAPTLVLIHGGPTSRNTNAFNTLYYFWTPYLLRLGYSILLPNYRGSTGRGEDYAAWSTFGVGKVDYEDVIALTDHAIQSGYSDSSRLVVGGLSQGGFLSYLCSTRNGSIRPWKFRASIPLAGITETDTMALTSDLGASLETELNGGNAVWNCQKDDTRNRQASALWEIQAAVDRSKKTGAMVIPPMLILHGEKDERCPITQAWGMRRALEAHGLEYQFVTYPRQAHIFSERKFWIDLALRIGDWTEKYIGPGVPVDGQT
ncbi:dipeptidyl aminopeptidase like protein [Zymoseptoria brevis]|uniref:Dipeptidyl-peptidase V n=1 Tax=Zymoseptoria brevis TaxID=1047168 RepID=A0A0F4GRF0_9PEZI|nr:dipeptidyl aminopeptidase like protein [Zymoseptoria brevis]